MISIVQCCFRNRKYKPLHEDYADNYFSLCRLCCYHGYVSESGCGCCMDQRIYLWGHVAVALLSVSEKGELE